MYMYGCSKHNRNLDWAYFALNVADKIIEWYFRYLWD